MRELILIAPGLAARRASLHYEAVAMPGLDRLFTVGYVTSAETTLADGLCQAFGIARQQDAPLAPLCAAWDGLFANEGYWLRADPVHLQLGMRGMTLLTAAHIGLTAAESAAYAASLAPVFAAAGWQLHAPHPQRWYVRLPHAPDLITTPLDYVAGRHINTALPAGRDAAEIMQRLNEVQIALHDHSLNEAREMRGEKPVNSLWLWGGGVLPEALKRGRRVYAEQAEAHALAARVQTQASPCPARFAELPKRDDALVVLPECPPDATAQEIARLDCDWFRPLLLALRLGRIGRAKLILTGVEGRSAQTSAWNAWQIWK